MNKIHLNKKQINWIEIILIVAFAFFPLLSSFPYRVNIFLSWEGAYRLYLGQIPYKDFGLPMGFGYWVIPAIAFKIFGPYLYTLIKAQVFINIISGLAFRSILKSFDIYFGIRLATILLFLVSYSLFNFWPWYNHSVIVYQLIGFSFLLKFIFNNNTNWHQYLNILLASFFLFFSFFTKQDGGALALFIALFIVLYDSIIHKNFKYLALFMISYSAWAGVFIIPFLGHDFSYWFNLGQAPHNSRIALWDFVQTFFGESQWEKLYLSGFILVFVARWKKMHSFIQDRKAFIFFLFSLGILVQAIIFQVTSYTPPNNNIFFHSFMFAYFFSLISYFKRADLLPILTVCIMVMIWWSGSYWKYIDRKVQRFFPHIVQQDQEKISKNTYMVSDNSDNIKMDKWVFSELEVFDNIYMPKSTVDGVSRILAMDELTRSNPKVLNMTELTPLAYEIGYELETGQPLWYHKGVGIFDKEIATFVKKIEAQHYDLVLFETIPYLNNFYPDEIKEALQKKYLLVDSFLAPRRPTDSYIEVYTRQK